MKTIILTAIITLSFGIILSSKKKDTLKENLTVFSYNSFSAKSILATAD